MKQRVLLLVIGMLAIVAVAVACGKLTKPEKSEEPKAVESQIPGPPYGPEPEWEEFKEDGVWLARTRVEIITGSGWYAMIRDYDSGPETIREFMRRENLGTIRQMLDYLVDQVMAEGLEWEIGVRYEDSEANQEFDKRFYEILESELEKSLIKK